MTSDGRYLLAVAAGSDEISVLRILPNGVLQLVEGSPVRSGGRTPVSIAVHGSWVYVAHTGAGGSNYTGFILDSNGQLRPLAGSTYPLPDDAIPGQVLFNGDGTRLVGVRVGPDEGPSFIDSFMVSSDGRLTAAPGSPFPAERIGPFGSQFRPTDPTQLFLSNAHDGPNNASVSAYIVGDDASLTSIGGSPFPNYQTAACWLEISPDGQYLFTVNTAVSSISRYAIDTDGTLTLLGSTALKNPQGLRPFDLRLDPSGQYLYVVDAGAATVSVLAVSGGDLTELASSPVALPAGATPFGIVVN
jgi:6-phosphogluconolactonase